MRFYCPSRKDVLETPDQPLTPPGAEGSVYLIPKEPALVAKIFHAAGADNRREKVEALVANPFHDAGPALRWRVAAPQEILLDLSGRFVGYTMPRVSNAEALDEFFDPGGLRYRRELSFRGGLAIALAEMVAEVHRHNLDIVIGDLKPQNILADDRGSITLIDMDSVQLTTIQGATHHCGVVTEYFTAPELYGKQLRRERREPSSDLFALAVIIFQLLMSGWHPFAAAGDPDLVGRIRRGAFPYVTGSPDRPPAGAPPYLVLPVELLHLFMQAFVDGHWDAEARPTADLWVKVLKKNAKALSRCSKMNGPITVPMVGAINAPAASLAAVTPTVATLAAINPAAVTRRWRVGRRGVAAAVAAAIAVAVLPGLIPLSMRLWASTAPTPARRAWVTADDPHYLSRRETPAYWRRLRDGGGAPLCFDLEPIRGTNHEYVKP